MPSIVTDTHIHTPSGPLLLSLPLSHLFSCLSLHPGTGTSTRKPRLNSALVAQQAATLPGASGNMPNGKPASSSRHGSGHDRQRHKRYPARLKNVDRSTAQTREVTVNSVTVLITEYKAKPVSSRRESSEQSFSESNDSRS